ncbi:MAG: hypothetical protein OEO79_15120 [Gemmatimonadota bacterium]|nr:hypothetical protein [Gemmatimonadota bacterium]
MSDEFTLSRTSHAHVADVELREEILSHTGNDQATQGILRSIDRYGDDASILRYEVSRKTNSRAFRHGSAAAWSVKAVRA